MGPWVHGSHFLDRNPNFTSLDPPDSIHCQAYLTIMSILIFFFKKKKYMLTKKFISMAFYTCNSKRKFLYYNFIKKIKSTHLSSKTQVMGLKVGILAIDMVIIIGNNHELGAHNKIGLIMRCYHGNNCWINSEMLPVMINH